MKKEFNGAASKMIPTPDGTKRWYLNGRLHREDGPAFEGIDGTRHWYRQGRLHREDGPAVIEPDGAKQFWFDGIQTTGAELENLKRQRDKAEKDRARNDARRKDEDLSARQQLSADELRRRLQDKAGKPPRLGKKSGNE